jgi:hypothetical protein
MEDGRSLTSNPPRLQGNVASSARRCGMATPALLQLSSRRPGQRRGEQTALLTYSPRSPFDPRVKCPGAQKQHPVSSPPRKTSAELRTAVDSASSTSGNRKWYGYMVCPTAHNALTRLIQSKRPWYPSFAVPRYEQKIRGITSTTARHAERKKSSAHLVVIAIINTKSNLLGVAVLPESSASAILA